MVQEGQIGTEMSSGFVHFKVKAGVDSGRNLDGESRKGTAAVR